jgi:hypothetical protein
MRASQRRRAGDGVRGAGHAPRPGIVAAGCARSGGDEPAVVFSPVDAGACAGLPTPDDRAGAEPAMAPPAGSGSGAAGAGPSGAVPTAGSCGGAAADGPFAGVSADDPVAVSAALSEASEVLAGIQAGIARLRGLPLWTLQERDLLELTRQVESTVRSGFGVQVRLAGEVAERGVADVLSARSSAHLLHQCLNITIGEARGRIAAARTALPNQTPSGEVIAPAAPELLDAIDRGQLSAGHARVITGCLTRIPAAVDPDTRQLCRDTLLEQAGKRDEIGLRQVAEQIRHIVDPDGTLSGKDPDERAELHIGHKRQDGLTPIRGLLSPLTAEQFRIAIQALSAPTPIDADTPDPRPAELRREQALGEILHRHLTAGAGPRDGGVRPQVVVTIGLDDLLGRLHGSDSTNPGGQTCPGGSAWSDYDGIQSVAMARLLACDAAIIPQVLGSDGAVLEQGRAVRLFTAEQRRALTTRDRGCTAPGCDIPPAWTQAHHIIWWSRGGRTDVTNGVLLCRRHHTEIHTGPWEIRADPGGGRPWFIPPPHLDPERKPRRNTHFHPPDLPGAVGPNKDASPA